ncbi:thioredoxin family protein [Kaarinaea lacus]
MKVRLLLYPVLAVFFIVSGSRVQADTMDSYQIGGHGRADIVYPAWFKQSFLDLRDDLDDARKAGKRGIIVFFSFKHCSHCEAFVSTTMSDPATMNRIQERYDVIALDIFNDTEVTDIDGNVTTIRNFAEASKARLTPTLIFYGIENEQLVKIVGFYPPEKFNRVLDYIDGGYHKKVKLSEYLRSSTTGTMAKLQPVNYQYDFLTAPPHDLQRSSKDAERPLLVIFDEPGCVACLRFHKRVLSDDKVSQSITTHDAILLDRTDNTSKLVLPDGRTLTPQQWANELQLSYDISVVFFDTQGREVHRLDSETGRDRMLLSMQYVLDKGYERHEQYLRWIREQQQQNKLRKY